MEENGYPSVHILLGRVLERSDHTILRLDRIDARLGLGDEKLDQLHDRLTVVETRKAGLSIGETISLIERAGKLLLAWGLPPLAVWMTGGNLEKALQWLQQVK
jgi:hypothetical protein